MIKLQNILIDLVDDRERNVSAYVCRRRKAGLRKTCTQVVKRPLYKLQNVSNKER